ncbi:MAG TPA: methyltransferase domain-containing protein [Paracoccaceae bacterium]|nr:methyltransferase domain-containing protein [Paracoccaceae bacterium]
MADWDPEDYARFRGERLRPALDLLRAVPDLPEGPLVDLGCGKGVMGPVLRARLPGRFLVGADASPAMLDAARARGVYDTLAEADIARWASDAAPALIFSNAALHWIPDHAALLPRLAAMLAPGGVLAVQMPRQSDAPSHRLIREVAAAMFPERFRWSADRQPVAAAEAYHGMLHRLGRLDLWETVYFQDLAPAAEGHPVRLFTQSTAARPVLERLNPEEQASFLTAYDAALADPYPRGPDGGVLFPFRRLFLVLERA